jgi:hypothetical protein
MKYKKQIATGALALSLLVGGSSIFAASPQDLGIKNVQSVYQKQNKSNKNLKINNQGKSSVVGTVGMISSAGFTVDVKNMKTNVTSSVDVKTNAGTVYSKNGVSVKVSGLALGQKVIVSGNLDKNTNILTAKTVKIAVTKK